MKKIEEKIMQFLIPFFENWLPFITSLTALVGLYFFDPQIKKIQFESILEISLTVSSIIIGFVSTMIAIVSSLSTTRIIKILREHKASMQLYRYFRKALIGNFLLITISLLLVIYSDFVDKNLRHISMIWTFLLFFSVALSFRVIYFAFRMLIEEERIAIREENVQTATKNAPHIKTSNKLPDGDKQWDPNEDEY